MSKTCRLQEACGSACHAACICKILREFDTAGLDFGFRIIICKRENRDQSALGSENENVLIRAKKSQQQITQLNMENLQPSFVIDREAGEIMRLVASVCLCVCVFVCLRVCVFVCPSSPV